MPYNPLIFPENSDLNRVQNEIVNSIEEIDKSLKQILVEQAKILDRLSALESESNA